jgi:multidrug efflux pump subunit AcrA (membrane-fusion protein)
LAAQKCEVNFHTDARPIFTPPSMSVPTLKNSMSDTVVRVYVENTYQVKAGQPLVDLGPRDYQVAVENAEANLA